MNEHPVSTLFFDLSAAHAIPAIREDDPTEVEEECRNRVLVHGIAGCGRDLVMADPVSVELLG
jgi:hypothetical protein